MTQEAYVEMRVKIVNTSAAATTAKINLKNFAAKSASVIRLTATKGTEENRLDNLTHVFPVEETVTTFGDCVVLDTPACFLNILKVKR